jgi:hypothetical protein
VAAKPLVHSQIADCRSAVEPCAGANDSGRNHQLLARRPRAPRRGPVFKEDAVREIFELIGPPRIDIIANVICAAEP